MIFYCDYDGGSDAAAGTSFATRWKTLTSGATAARIAPGDTIRIMASPDATSLGQTAQWTDGPLPVVVNVGAASASNATPIVITAGGHLLATGDTVIVNGVTGNTAANGVWKVNVLTAATFQLLNADGTNSVGNGTSSGGTWRKFTNAVVTLTTAVTKNIALCGNRGTKTNWTASANVTCSIITTDYKEGGECLQVAIAAGFTTGLAAYYTLPSSTDFSSYQQISEWVKQTAGTLGAAGAVSIVLCSDTLGAIPVDTANVPAIGALNQWSPLVYDKAAALGATIQSIAFYVNTDNGAQTFLIDNIIACKASSSADSLNLTSLISKNTGSEAWFGIQSINGTRIVLDGTTNSIPGSSPQRGYSGTTEAVTLYKRETVKTAMAAATSTAVQTITDDGTAGSPITFSGGWNRTDMSTQTGETWFDGQNGNGQAITDSNSKTYAALDKLNFTRYYTGLNLGGASAMHTIGSVAFSNLSNVPIGTATSSRAIATITTMTAVCCGGALTTSGGTVTTTIARADSTTAGNGVTLGAGSWTGTITQANNNAGGGIGAGVASYVATIAAANGNVSSGYIAAVNSRFGSATCNSNTSYGLNLGNGNISGFVGLGGSTTGNGGQGVLGLSGANTLRNFTINESTEVSGFTAYADGRVYSEKHDGGTQASIFCDGGLIVSQTSVVHGSATRAWKFSPTSTNRSQYYPLNLAIAQIAVGASTLVTVSGWFQRNNTGLTAKLVCKGGQIAGVTSDVSASMTAAANTWELLTITFTPSESGVVEIEAQFYGGSTYNGYCSEFADISQA